MAIPRSRVAVVMCTSCIVLEKQDALSDPTRPSTTRSRKKNVFYNVEGISAHDSIISYRSVRGNVSDIGQTMAEKRGNSYGAVKKGKIRGCSCLVHV